MIEIILLSFFAVGIIGAGVILGRKMPVAQRMAANAGTLVVVNFGQAAKEFCVAGIKKVPCFRDFNWLDFVQKMLMKGRVFVLRAENKINDYMVKLRQKAEEEKNKEGQILDNYWHDLKTIVKTKNAAQPDIVKGVEPMPMEIEHPKSGFNQEAQTTDRFAGQPTVIEEQSAEGPTVSHVAMPDDAVQRGHGQSKKKKQGLKKRKFKDPFQW